MVSVPATSRALPQDCLKQGVQAARLRQLRCLAWGWQALV
jgi:hypothetical protein